MSFYSSHTWTNRAELDWLQFELPAWCKARGVKLNLALQGYLTALEKRDPDKWWGNADPQLLKDNAAFMIQSNPKVRALDETHFIVTFGGVEKKIIIPSR